MSLSSRRNRSWLAPFFGYLGEVRKLIGTNHFMLVNMSLRKMPHNQRSFQRDEAKTILFYLAPRDIRRL